MQKHATTFWQTNDSLVHILPFISYLINQHYSALGKLPPEILAGVVEHLPLTVLGALRRTSLLFSSPESEVSRKLQQIRSSIIPKQITIAEQQIYLWMQDWQNMLRLYVIYGGNELPINRNQRADRTYNAG